VGGSGRKEPRRPGRRKMAINEGRKEAEGRGRRKRGFYLSEEGFVCA